MLLIDRKNQEEITILLTTGEIITVKVVHLTNKEARIGVDAPKTVKIYRNEIYLEKLSEGSL